MGPHTPLGTTARSYRVQDRPANNCVAVLMTIALCSVSNSACATSDDACDECCVPAAASGRCSRAVQDDDGRSGQGVQRDHGSHPGGPQNLPAVRHLNRLRKPVLLHHWTGSFRLPTRRSVTNTKM